MAKGTKIPSSGWVVLFLVAVQAGWTRSFSPMLPLHVQRTKDSSSSIVGSFLLMSISEEDSLSSNDTIITKEMFLRDLLRHPNDELYDTEEDESASNSDRTSKNTSDEENSSSSVSVKRKDKKSKKRGYRVLDNRDSLPFAVNLVTPDPYTHPDIKKDKARKQSVIPPKRHDAVEAGVSSSLFIDAGNDVGKAKKGNGEAKSSSNIPTDPSTWIGDFVLDKLTTTGDILEIGDRQYKVVRHRCLYKYAGGRRFVMTRKILQVKEVTRVQAEEYLQAQLKLSNEVADRAFPVEEQ